MKDLPAVFIDALLIFSVVSSIVLLKPLNLRFFVLCVIDPLAYLTAAISTRVGLLTFLCGLLDAALATFALYSGALIGRGRFELTLLIGFST